MYGAILWDIIGSPYEFTVPGAMLTNDMFFTAGSIFTKQIMKISTIQNNKWRRVWKDLY
jgi:hypothetical protein